MKLNSIVINFDSPEEQKQFEDLATKHGLLIIGKETYQKDFAAESWTELDISGCIAEDLVFLEKEMEEEEETQYD